MYGKKYHHENQVILICIERKIKSSIETKDEKNGKKFKFIVIATVSNILSDSLLQKLLTNDVLMCAYV